MEVESTFGAAMAASSLEGSRKGEASHILDVLEEAAKDADPAVLRNVKLVDFTTFLMQANKL